MYARATYNTIPLYRDKNEICQSAKTRTIIPFIVALVAGEIAKEIRKKSSHAHTRYAVEYRRVDKGRRTAEDKPIHHIYTHTDVYII